MNLRKDHYHTDLISQLCEFSVTTVVTVWANGSSDLAPYHMTLIYWTIDVLVNEPPKLEWIYNFQQRMSWLPQRWRTQRNAIRNANCRIRESSNLWTHIALPGFPGSMLVWVSVNPTHMTFCCTECVCIWALIKCADFAWLKHVVPLKYYELCQHGRYVLFSTFGSWDDNVGLDSYATIHLQLRPQIKQEDPLNLSI